MKPDPLAEKSTLKMFDASLTDSRPRHGGELERGCQGEAVSKSLAPQLNLPVDRGRKNTVMISSGVILSL